MSNLTENTKIAKWWSLKNGKAVCELCPRFCVIGEKQNGFCYLRFNEGGILKTKGFGRTTGFSLDPIEKKPLYHVLPRKRILSFGTVGCNMGCRYCQNWNISKARNDESVSVCSTSLQIIEKAYEMRRTSGNVGIAFTYNEPTIWAEWICELAALAKEYDLISVMVTNGYINKQAIREIYPLIDAANIDLKGFSENFYTKLTLSHLKPVLDAIIAIKHEGTWVELTTLLIPGYNDNERELSELSKWVVNNCGENTPLHFTAFHPDYKLTDAESTKLDSLKTAYKIARNAGLKYVYTGNVYDQFTGSTYCHGCGKVLIRRNWYDVELKGLIRNRCKYCGYRVAGIF
jgi:pyruvate formate lyase activating enzyme